MHLHITLRKNAAFGQMWLIAFGQMLIATRYFKVISQSQKHAFPPTYVHGLVVSRVYLPHDTLGYCQ